jgi:BTB/POZ domain
MREEFSDMNLVVGSHLIAVHQLVLSAHSHHLASLLNTHQQASI